MNNPKTDWYFKKEETWHKEIAALRDIVLECHLAEDLKWGCPCYLHDSKNIVLIHTFKEYCALLFFKGALLADPKGLLTQQTQQVQSARQMRFTTLAQITKQRKAIQAFVYEAVSVAEKGLKVAKKATADYPVPEELTKALAGDAQLKAAFEALTPGRQRSYLLHFAQAKQPKTREARIQKSIPDILAGKGWNER